MDLERCEPIGQKDRALKMEECVETHLQSSKLLDFGMSRTPKNGGGNPILGPGFPNRNLGIVRPTDSLKLGFCNKKPRNHRCTREIQNTGAGFPNGNPNFNRNF